MGSTVVAKDKLSNFNHMHQLSLQHLQPIYKNENVDDEDEIEDEDEDDFVEEEHHGGQCDLCKKNIWSFHLCYYYCKSCDYSLHKLCAELPMIQQNHPLHPSHKLHICSPSHYEFKCFVCNLNRKNISYYYCFDCDNYMDIICATMSEQKINHPSHPHQLDLMFGDIVSCCVACGNKHEGELFQCATCPSFRINLHCALLPAKLLIQNYTGGTFTHSHPLTLPIPFQNLKKTKGKFYPHCRVCDGGFYFQLWIYKCDKCRYYVHVDCATSKREGFMSMSGVKIPLEVQDYMGHPEHTLFLLAKISSKFFGVFKCAICLLPSNSFAYGCTRCECYVDINCAFIPEEITHEAYPGHFLSKVIPSPMLLERSCEACINSMAYMFGFHCPSYDFYIHVKCALFLPRVIKHKCDKHPLSLRYDVLENHISEYFCELCEDEFSPWQWFYHCATCAQYMHAACVSLILLREQTAYSGSCYGTSVYKFINFKFGGTLKIRGLLNDRFAFILGLKSDGECFMCGKSHQGKMIFKCLDGESALDYKYASSFISLLKSFTRMTTGRRLLLGS